MNELCVLLSIYVVYTYIRRNNRIMQTRLVEHVLRWLQNRLISNAPINVRSRKLCSSIAKRIIKTRYRFDINTAFETLYRNYLFVELFT